ncbi:MAG TPA: glycoside hydrolase family 2 TIM barrel-domain containing protein [Fimbriimonas sp.]|nr:glycoside hydrolase family 2 TIM barrel-domain containing protein [Fimbriimonas sp.]
MLLGLLLLSTTGSPRTVLDFNAGWQVATVPSRPTIWTAPDAVPTSTWRVLHVSSQETNRENGRAENAFDGNPRTFWHSRWSSNRAPYPHDLLIDLGSTVTATGIRILPRQTPPQNGRPKTFQLFLSNDPNTTKLTLEGSLPDSQNLYQAPFPTTTGRYLKIRFTQAQTQEPFLCIAELGLIRKTSIKEATAWNTQYNIERVEVGDSRFDPSPLQIEIAKKEELRRIAKTAWTSVALPNSPQIKSLDSPEIWQGVLYYRRSFPKPPRSDGKHLELTIDGAMQSSECWLNGQHVGSHRGGYLPMIVDVTGKLRSDNELLVRVDNRDNPLIPPGKPQAELDFMYGNGLTRNAILTETNPLHITNPLVPKGENPFGGIYVTCPRVLASQAMVRVRTQIENNASRASGFQLVQQVRDAKGLIVSETADRDSLRRGQANSLEQELAITRPHLWTPNDPYLYTLTTCVLRQGVVTDRIDTPVGIRSVYVSRKDGFVLNGSPIRLIGTNRHQDYPWIGGALSDRAQLRDALLIKRAGHNILRLSHYPQSPAFMDACDRLGIMTIPCIPGWQFMNKDPRFRQRVRQDIRDLIRRDRNHPSVVWWEASLNETYPPAKDAKEWYDAAKSESVDGRVLTAGDGGVKAPWDIVYNRWDDATMGRPQDLIPSKPGYIREYGDYEFGGATSSSRARIGAGADALLQEAWNEVWSCNHYLDQYPWTMGEGTWEMFDHNVPWDFKVSASGLADLFRRPKPSYWFFASQWAPDPIVKICRTRDTVIAFSNCDEIRLFQSGKLLATQKPTRGKTTSYAETKPFDGSNTEYLPHPPVVFRNLPFESRNLEAVGYTKGRRSVSDQIQPAGKPTRLKVYLDDLGVPAGKNDRLFIRAAIVDELGTVCPISGVRVAFKVQGAATLIAESTSETELGIATTLLATNPNAGKIEVTAKTPSLYLSGNCTVRVK